MSVPVIICRAEPGASQTQENVERLGLLAVKCPALEIQSNPNVALPDPETIAGLLFTSANGVRTFAARSKERNLPAWCVGPATADAAEAHGFTQVHISSGDSIDLANFIIARSTPSPKPLLHVANSAAKGKLRRRLEAAGYATLFAPLYQAAPVAELSDTAEKLISHTVPAIALFHSEKGGEAFLNLCKGLPVSQLAGVVISRQAATPLMNAGFSDIHIAAAPNEEALMQTLKIASATLSV